MEMAKERPTLSSLPEWWQSVSVRQQKLYELHELALAHSERETAALCKQLLREAEAMVKAESSAWIRRVDEVLAEYSADELRRDT